jgi:RHH-type proline utilization regulon transcriptional repressor/proline dehydrogenase/delta 1-pyrroline-5-carboxylate dehydrogenase
VLCVFLDEPGLLRQISAILATGNTALVPRTREAEDCLRTLPPPLAARVRMTADPRVEAYDAVLFDAAPSALQALCRSLVDRPGPIVPVYAVARESPQDKAYPLDALVRERSISINTAAAGGNASLMMLG